MLLDDRYGTDLIADTSVSMGKGPVRTKNIVSTNSELRELRDGPVRFVSMGKHSLPVTPQEEEQQDLEDGAYARLDLDEHIYSYEQKDSTPTFSRVTSLPSNPASGSGEYRTILYWVPEKYAFRAQASFEDHDTYANIGNGSIAMGIKNKASGGNTIAIGSANTVTGGRAIGGSNTVTAGNTFGDSNTVAISTGLALGDNNTVNVASATDCIAIGGGNTAGGISQNHCIAIGHECSAIHNETIAMGRLASTAGPGSTAIGDRATATSSSGDATAVGYRCNAGAIYSSVFGWYSSATGVRSTTVGYDIATTVAAASTFGSAKSGTTYTNNIANSCQLVANGSPGIIVEQTQGTDTVANVGIANVSFGTSAQGVFALANTGTEPAAVAANAINLYAKDATVESSLCAMGVYSEQPPVAKPMDTFTHGVPVWWNGTEYYLPLGTTGVGGITTVAAATHSTAREDRILHVTYTATGAVTITLSSADAVAGKVITIKDAGGNAATNNITIDTEGAETIDGDTELIVNSDYDAPTIYSDGTNWYIGGH